MTRTAGSICAVGFGVLLGTTKRGAKPAERRSPAASWLPLTRPIVLATIVLGASLLIGCEEPVGPHTGTIKVTSTPSGARVFFDGSDTGWVTPYTVLEVPAGSHTIRLTLDGHTDWGPEAVTVTAGQTASVDATLEPIEPLEPEPPEEYALGLLPVDAQAYRNAPILRAEPVASLPASVDLSADIPRPGNQGQQGSCVGWAVAYALKTYHERIERGWPLNDDRHVMSPAYLYNQIKEPGGGAYFANAFSLLMTQGVSSWALMPYKWQDDDSLPSLAAITEASNYRIAEWGTVLHPSHAEFVPEIKRHLAAGTPVVIGIWVNHDFDSLSESNPVYNYHDGCEWPRERCRAHAITIVGYSDRMAAFKFINSWGTNWGIGGYGWIAYDYSRLLIWEAYVTRDEIDLPDDEPPEAASDPVPRDGTVNVAVDTVLNWTRNARTTSFDVYLGLDREIEAVDLQGSVAQASFSPSLAPGSRYYWRVDARGAGGVTEGPVWSFTTAEERRELPGKAVNPSPANGATGVSRDVVLRWASGGHTTSFDVYFGRSPTLGASELQRTQAGRTFSPGRLSAGTRYYWRVDAKNGQGTTTGDVWSFTTEAATPPSEPPTIIRVLPDVTLASPTASARTFQMTSYVTGATRYSVKAAPEGVVQATIAGEELTVRPVQAGTATVSVEASNADGSVTLSMSVRVNELPPEPPVIIKHPAPITFASPDAAAETLVVRSYISGATGYDVRVDPAGIVTARISNHVMTITPHAAGQTTVQVQGKNDDGTSPWLQVSVTVTAPPPPPDPELSIADASVTEGNSGSTPLTFRLTLSAASTQRVRAWARTLSGTAAAGSDFENRSGWVTFPPGRTWQDFEVRVYGDTEAEQDERFQVVVERVEHATLVDGIGTGTIVNDDAQPLPEKAINPSPANGATGVARDVVLRWASGGHTTSYDVYFGPRLPPTSRQSGPRRTFSPGGLSDGTRYYWRVDAKNGQGTTTGDVWSFTTALPGLSVANASVNEGNSGTRDMLFRVTLSAPSAQVVQAYIQTTGDGTATHTVDYEWTIAWPLTFSPGETSKAFRVRVYGDTEVESDETFVVKVQQVEHATLVNGTATGTIVNDDARPLPEKALNPSPANGATGVARDVVLRWASGGHTTSYDVYFGPRLPPTSRQSGPRRTFSPGGLSDGTRYYWRVDAKNGQGTTTGDVWSFTTAERDVPPPRVSGKMYWTLGLAHPGPSNKIQRADLDGTNVETVVDAGYNASGILIRGNKMYWVDRWGIRQANLDGSNVRTIVSEHSNDLAFHRGKMYWTGNGFIRRADLDGTSIETLVTGQSFFWQIALHGDKMYWTLLEYSSGARQKIRRADLGGTNAETLAVHGRHSLIGDLALFGGKLYWTHMHNIYRSNPDGSNVETFIRDQNVRAIAFHGGNIYWSDTTTSAGTGHMKIKRADLDYPVGIELLVSSSDYYATGIAIAP